MKHFGLTLYIAAALWITPSTDLTQLGQANLKMPLDPVAAEVPPCEPFPRCLDWIDP